MTDFEWGVILTTISTLLVAVIALRFKLNETTKELVNETVKEDESELAAHVRALTDTELNTALDHDLGRPAAPAKKDS